MKLKKLREELKNFASNVILMILGFNNFAAIRI